MLESGSNAIHSDATITTGILLLDVFERCFRQSTKDEADNAAPCNQISWRRRIKSSRTPRKISFGNRPELERQYSASGL